MPKKKAATATASADAPLLANIWRAPEDRDALAVYADWLLQNGDATRGEYMQLALLEKPTPVQTKRRETLRKKHRGEWLGEARPFVYTWEESETSPGFVRAVKCATAKLAAGFEQIRALGPRVVVEVNPTASKRDREVLASLPLGTLYGLNLADGDVFWLKDKVVRELLPSLTGLRALHLCPYDDEEDKKSFSVDTWRAILDALPTLEEIGFMADGSVSDSYIDVLLAHPIAKKLRIVSLGQSEHMKDKIAKACPKAAVSFW